MKFAGKTLNKPNIEICVIPRGDGEDIVFTAKSIPNLDEFHAICPMPLPNEKIIKGGQKVKDFQSPLYLALMENYSQKRLDYIALKSLQATEGLEWETVDFADPDTWRNYETELKEAGFAETEIMMIITTVLNANSLNQTRLDQARDRFLASQREAQENLLYSQEAEHSITLSGELVSESELNHPE